MSRLVLLLIAGGAAYCISSTSTHALVVSPGSSARVDFTLDFNDVTGVFEFPAVMMDYTLEFDIANPLNPGEGYRIETYTPNGTLLGTDGFGNVSSGAIIGCACITMLLDPVLGASLLVTMIPACSCKEACKRFYGK